MRWTIALSGLLWACDGGPPVVHGPTDDTDIDEVIGPALRVDCNALPAEVYALPATGGERVPGTAEVCATGTPIARVAVSVRLEELGIETQARSGYAQYIVGYWTERSKGELAWASAQVLVPDLPASTQGVSVVVVSHDVVGVADSCAPSRSGVDMDGLVLPWVAAGFVVVVPDNRGLGTPGVPGYRDVIDTAWSVLDGGRAAHGLLSSVGDELVLVGQGHGGGAVLTAQALAAERLAGSDVSVGRVIAMGADLATRDPGPTYRTPNMAIASDTVRASMAVALQTDFANLLGEQSSPDPLNPAIRDAVVAKTQSSCAADLVASLATSEEGYIPPTTLGQLIDPDLRLEIVGCVAQNSRCTDRAQAFVDRHRANQIPLDPAGAPVALIVAESDPVYGLERQACLRDKLDDEQVSHDICVVPNALASDLALRAAPFAMSWSGLGPEVPCAGVQTLPRCPFE